MALDMFMQISGIEGESVDRQFAGHIDVLAWSWGVTRPGGPKGAPEFQALSWTKWIDASSVDLLLASAAGRRIPSAQLRIRRPGTSAGSESPVVYEVRMKDVLVSSVSTGGSGGEDRLTENVTLNYTEVEWTYHRMGPDGSIIETETGGYDLRKGAVS